MLATEEFAAVPELAGALRMLSPEKFARRIAFLARPVEERVRTNHHVERTNRRVRLLEKVRSKGRRRRSLVRLLVMTLDRWRRADAGQPQPSAGGPKPARPPDRSEAA